MAVFGPPLPLFLKTIPKLSRPSLLRRIRRGHQLG
jgi:hypothetical protein